ncbi:hypothetical protein BDW71DRAFT_186766 [Aspergillus fruticulosus]
MPRRTLARLRHIILAVRVRVALSEPASRHHPEVIKGCKCALIIDSSSVLRQYSSEGSQLCIYAAIHSPYDICLPLTGDLTVEMPADGE